VPHAVHREPLVHQRAAVIRPAGVPVYTGELLATGQGGIGYLLKERVGDVPAFLDALRRVAAGGTALEREVVAELMQTRVAATTGRSPRSPRASTRCSG
jgi:hypothetical protein